MTDATDPARSDATDPAAPADATGDGDDEREPATADEATQKRTGHRGYVVRNWLLAIIAIVLVGWALKATQAVTMPLAFALLLIALAWPLRQWFQRFMGPIASIVAATLAVGAFIGLFFYAVYFAVSSIVQKVPDYADRFQDYYEQFSAWVVGMGMPSPQDAMENLDLGAMAQTLLMDFYSATGTFFLILVLATLGLPEVPMLEKRVKATFSGHDRREIREGTRVVVSRLQNFLAGTVSTAAITGVATWGFAWAVGLDFAVVWGLMAFVLDFVPVVGSIISIIPPALFALVQFDGWLVPLGVASGIAAIQLFMGNVFYPNVVGHGVALPPVVLLFSLTLWGWIWGIPGALLATPITVTLIIVASRFEALRWMTLLIERRDPDKCPELFAGTSSADEGRPGPGARAMEGSFADAMAHHEKGEQPEPAVKRVGGQGSPPHAGE